MNASDFAAWIRRAAELVTADAERLTALDAAIGDGDHGLNLARGFGAAVTALDGLPAGTTPGKVLIGAGRAIVSKTGGASGPLYGTALRRAGKTLGDAAEPDAAALGTALRAALDGVRELGGAGEGDKTMVDALAAAVTAYETAVDGGAGLPAAARAAATGAAEGAEATVPMVARKGRASYLGPRSAGHLDPGAASTVLLLRALADVTGGEG
ncbi:dihydroxyacetone kinase, C-terminal domain [Thermomonospora echinospora]|uniref:Dihydroxyacetone kinase, C-terminal domain n=1 Tax=Thermomonospora echinospora TaxID=1992 RepID=A0A1H5ZGK0_9ACTN|nr:dihydroxyacetone kinase subunit DhaL [Thermomonospora echinospora]SEG34757.1 dihydroxyacetone kinase, C-terminal domain [Thermomonospora echinospora]